MSSHWASNYIGLRWEEGSDGPNSYDCWSLARHILVTYYNTPLPNLRLSNFDVRKTRIALRDDGDYNKWEEVNTGPLKDGDCILLSGTQAFSHVGVVLRVNGSFWVMHSLKGSGVVFQEYDKLFQMGWRQRKLYRWVE